MDVPNAPDLQKRWVKAIPTIGSGWLAGWLVILANWSKIVISFFFLACLLDYLLACLQREKWATISISETICVKFGMDVPNSFLSSFLACLLACSLA